MATESPETTTLSQEHKEQTSALKKYAWVPGLVYTGLGIGALLFTWGVMYGGDMSEMRHEIAKVDKKVDLLLMQQGLVNTRLAAHEAIDSLREWAHRVSHKKYDGLFIMIGRRFNFNDKYFETIQQ